MKLADRMCRTSRAGIDWSAGDRIIPIESAFVRDMVTANALETRNASPKPHLGLGEEEGGCSHRGTLSCGIDLCWLMSGPDKLRPLTPGHWVPGGDQEEGPLLHEYGVCIMR